MDVFQLVLIRASERLLAVLVGGFSIYLGYRLFIAMPQQADSSGKLVLPGNISIFFSRVGPGVFFSLFGAAVVSLSIYRGLQAETTRGLPAETPAAASKIATANISKDTVIYANEPRAGESDARRLAARRAGVRVAIAELNKLPSALAEDFPKNRIVDVTNAIRDSKLALLETVWAKDGGDVAVFRNWVVNDGEAEPIPAGVRPETVEIFRAGNNP